MREQIRSHLQYKLMLGFSMVLLPALALISLYTQISTRDILISRTHDEQMRLATTRASAAEDVLADIGTDLLLLTRDSAVIRVSQGDAAAHSEIGERFLSFLARSGRRYIRLCLTDEGGDDLICARMDAGKPTLATVTPPDPQPQTYPEAPAGGPRDRPQMHIDLIRQASPQGVGDIPSPVLRYRIALRTESGAGGGQIILDVASQPIFDLLIDPAPLTQTTIIDQRGTYILGPATGSLLSDRPDSAALILSRPGGTILGADDSPDAFTTYYEVRLPDQGAHGWVIIYERPLAAILAPINQARLVNIALTAALLIVGLLITYLLTRSIVRPVRALAAAAERVGAGDLSFPIATDSHDEIGALAHTLDRTVARLRATLESADSRRREAETLYTTAIALSSTLDLHQLLGRILNELLAVVPYDSSTVQLVRGDQVEIIGAYGLARPERLIGTTFPIHGEGPNAEVAQRRTTLILDDAPNVYAHFNEEPYRADPIRSWMGIPLIFGERLIGMITIDKYEPGFYTPEHARIASAFAAQAAIALENARLYEAIRDELAERRLSEQAQTRLLAILEATTDVVGSADTQGRLLFLNSAGRRMLGLDEHADIVGLPIRSFLPDESLAQILTVGAPAAIRDGIWSGELTLRREDGSEIPTSQVIIAHRDAEGNPEYFSTIVRDISERLRAEEQLRQAQKMEAVGRLAGGVSHDFNNILTVIMGECDLMLHGPGLSPELREGLDQIHQAGTRAAALTRQLLAFSRRQVLQPTTINLNTIITPIEQMLRRLIGEDVILQTYLADDLATVRADPSQIEQVILNLCINGRDAMPQGGRLSLTTANVAVGEGGDHDLMPGDYVLLTVHDTGSGIEDSAREHIFEPFFTTKPRGKGTGLGLATVHGIIQQSGGAIFFSSTLGQGSSFHVYLPAVAGPSAAARPLSRARPPIAHVAVVLLVEDDDRVRRLARQILADHGLTVIEAADGAGALRICTQHQGQIDLLLSDIVMPGGINGVQLAARIRASHPMIKAILMSGYTDNALASAGSIPPETHFLQKPFSTSDLLEKVYEALAIEA
ncbi:response regulator [Oscillochloris sp. ZM17-4]|uniref:ATP-binding protein n=1 Tax=Oscillochloris sp. ZM17-4 TaxID=2866714 RepID=UPI001C7375C5|nr:ATP-binding protein [Oscillochloris sp. ZM17-4]MBX0328975.1 response regulator [Oscillochloris sp. ZM17-4]